MRKNSRIYIAGHRGLVGTALMNQLRAGGYDNLVVRTHAELDLTEQNSVRDFFNTEQPEYVFLAAAKVGGILANNSYPAEFIRENLAIQTNLIHEAYRAGVKRLLFLGSSCIYPRDCPQPIREEYLLSGPLEKTNRPYAIAKISGIEMCWSYNRQYGTHYLAAMPTNLYGPGDNYDLENSHVLPALLRKMHQAKQRGDSEVVIWGTGVPRREFLYSDDMAGACVHLMNLPDTQFDLLISTDTPPLVNIGCGADVSIVELAELIKDTVGFDGSIRFDTSKPDGTLRKLLDISIMHKMGWRATTGLKEGLSIVYKELLATE